MRPIVADVTDVCAFVRTMHCAKTDEPIEMVIGV